MMTDVIVGAAAPDFDLEGLDGKRVRLASFREKKVLVAFLRNARCAVCNLWVHETAKVAPRWRERGLEVIAVFESSADKLRAQLEGRHPPFAVVADPDGVVHERFGSDVDRARVEALVASGDGKPALARAAAAGFEAQMEEGANFHRIPAEILVDDEGRVRVIHHADQVFNHLSGAAIEAFLGVP